MQQQGETAQAARAASWWPSLRPFAKPTLPLWPSDREVACYARGTEAWSRCCIVRSKMHNGRRCLLELQGCQASGKHGHNLANQFPLAHARFASTKRPHFTSFSQSYHTTFSFNYWL